MNPKKMTACGWIISIIFLASSSFGGDFNLHLPLIMRSPSSSPPTLLAVSIKPSSAPSGAIVNIIFEFQFSDPDGDLDGGALVYIDPVGVTNSLTIPDSYRGRTSGIGYGYLNNLDNGLSPGTYTIPVFLKDKTGKQSNSLSVVWTVT